MNELPTLWWRSWVMPSDYWPYLVGDDENITSTSAAESPIECQGVTKAMHETPRQGDAGRPTMTAICGSQIDAEELHPQALEEVAEPANHEHPFP